MREEIGVDKPSFTDDVVQRRPSIFQSIVVLSNDVVLRGRPVRNASQQISAGDNALQNQQELSYRKQIARQLRTQYVEGIYNKPMTLKSRLRVTQGY